MHLAHFLHRYPPAIGGAESYVARLSRDLAGRGHRVTVWSSTAIDLEAMHGPGRNALTGEDHAGGIAVRRFRPLRFPGRRILLKAASLFPVRPWQALTLPCNPVCPAMWRAAGLFRGPLDAVHASAFPYSFPTMCGLRLARRRRVPFLLTPFLHLGDPTVPADRTRRQYTAGPLGWLLLQADRIFVQTLSEFQAVCELGVRDERIVLQGLGVDVAECTGGDRALARRNWGVEGHQFVVGHLANNSVEKGTVDLLKAARHLDSSIRIVLAGPEMPNFRRFWETYPEKRRVVRLGPLSEHQKRDFFAGIDAFALPSRSDSFGLVLLEAWANAKPIVCYRAGGPAELVQDGDDGYVVPCGAIESLADRLTRMAANGYHAARLGRPGRDRLGAYRWEDKLRVVRTVLEDVVTRGQERIRQRSMTPVTSP